jgi:hypothetical protein
MTSDRMVINRTRSAIGQDEQRGGGPDLVLSGRGARLGDVHCRRRPGIPPAAGAVPPRRSRTGSGRSGPPRPRRPGGVLTARLCRANGY